MVFHWFLSVANAMIFSLFDIITFGLVLSFGIWGHFVGAIPQIAGLVFVIVSAFSGIFVGSILSSTMLHIFNMPILLVTGTICIITIFINYCLWLFFVPKNLARDVYLDTPVYYVSGSLFGAIQGYIWATIIFFCLSFSGTYTYSKMLSESISEPIMHYSSKILGSVVPTSIKNKIESFVDTNTKSITNNIAKHEVVNTVFNETENIAIEYIIEVLMKNKGFSDIDANHLRKILRVLPSNSLDKIKNRINVFRRKKTLNKDLSFAIVIGEFATIQQQRIIKGEKLIDIESDLQKLIAQFSMQTMAKISTSHYYWLSEMYGEKVLPQEKNDKIVIKDNNVKESSNDTTNISIV